MQCHGQLRTTKLSYVSVFVVIQHGLQRFHPPLVKQAVLTTQTDVEEPHQIVDLMRLFSDAETHQDAMGRTTTKLLLLQ